MGYIDKRSREYRVNHRYCLWLKLWHGLRAPILMFDARSIVLMCRVRYTFILQTLELISKFVVFFTLKLRIFTIRIGELSENA